MEDNFTQISFTKENLDRFYVRTSILNSIKKSLPSFKGKLLDAGCGKMPYKKFILSNSKVKEYIGLDIESALVYDDAIKPNYVWDGIKMPFDDTSFDTVMATEVLEHVPDLKVYLNEIYRVLKKEGVFFFTVPFLWPLHEVPHDEYRYTPFSLEKQLKNAGFSTIEIKATGGWHASMAQMLGLWVRRSPMPKNKRKVLSFILKPVIKFLIKLEKTDSVTFKEGQMITGLYGIIKK